MKAIKWVITLVLSVLLTLPVFAQIPPELLKKAEAGDVEAQSELCVMYQKGQDTPQDFKKAR